MDKNLYKRAFFGLAAFLVIMGLLIFLPAGTLHFWQAWLFLLVFGAWSIIVSLYFLKNDPELVKRRSRVGPIEEKEARQKFIQSLAFVGFVSYFVVPGLDHRFGWSDMPAYLVIAGDAGLSLGWWLVFVVMKVNSYASSTIEVVEGQTVISTGPYRIIRHPMYAGALPMLFFMPLALGSYWALLVNLPMLAVIIWRLLEEEKFLLKNLQGYEEYCRKTRYRLVPFVW